MNVKLLTAAAGATILLGGAAGGLAGRLAADGQAAAPGSCTFDGGGTIASGDAARTSDGREWVCTDGVLVRVAGYGNGPSAGPTPAPQTVLCELTHEAGTCPSTIP